MTKPPATAVEFNQPAASHVAPCPSCGYCPTCGRKNATPAYPYWPYPWYVNPWYQYPYTWTVSSGAPITGTTTVGGGTSLAGGSLTVNY